MVVLICMDGSKHSDYALKYYRDHIHQQSNRVYVVHCAHYHTEHWQTFSMTPADSAVLQSMIDKDIERISKVVTHLKATIDDLQLTAEIIKVHGNPGHALVEKSKTIGASMIVVGSRGVGTVRRTFLGSVSDYLVHHAHMPVLVCKHPQDI
ncbi:Stress response protein NhaX [Mizuhopecten yessoensis]|uniref:Stress response protein NhaX n=2 Tax=Mizuhopecten yessoensis TaxID=6573 RepID=A0A210R6Z6_MIZYE|nr:Stress response protein NhaX [Mizuhopecten yessoensis]